MSYRILSLDGGGVGALMQLKALIALYSANASGQTVLADFDLAAANSAGSIVLGGLVEGLELGELLDFFLDQAKRDSVFSPTQSLTDTALHDLTGLGPEYSAANKLSALQDVRPSKGTLPLSRAAAGLRRPGSSQDITRAWPVYVPGRVGSLERHQVTLTRSA